jgi:hypothetical protein
MNKYRVNARFVCDCLICQEEEQRSLPVGPILPEPSGPCYGVPFSYDFTAVSEEIAKELAKRKFEMIHDDVVDEFKEEKGHDYRLEILSCELVG